MQSSLKKFLCLFALQTAVSKVSAPTATILLKTMAIKRYSHTRTLFSSLESRKLPGNTGGL
jgi:hypothetical protein